MQYAFDELYVMNGFTGTGFTSGFACLCVSPKVIGLLEQGSVQFQNSLV